MINQETKAKILDACRIEEVVGDFVALKKRGANLLGVCPFHNEKTPSFTVSPAKGFFKCFGCGKAGDSVTFIMEHEHLSFPESLKYLANKYQITIEETAPTPEMVEAQGIREGLFAAMDFANQFYKDHLWNNEVGKAIGLSYFRERGFTDEIIHRFELGYAPDEWSALTTKSIEAGYKIDVLEKAGLTIIKEEKKYDRFRGRVIFPIHSLTGRAIAFGARILKKDPNSPKYLNSPETDIYYKSKALYGIAFAKKSIVANDECFLVEGYTDVVSMHQVGIENVVASSGTALTIEQIRLIGRYTKNITVLYDGDAAGIKASIRGIDLILEEGMNVRVVLFPDGDDPDSYAQKVDGINFKKFLKEQAVDFIGFKTKLLLAETNGDPIKKSNLIKELISSIALIPDAIYRATYLKQTAAQMEISEAVLLVELNKLLKSKFNKSTEGAPTPSAETIDPDQALLDNLEAGQTKAEALEAEHSTLHLEEELIRVLLCYADQEFQLEEEEEIFNERTNRIEVKTHVLNYKVKDYIITEIMEDGIHFTNSSLATLLAEFSNQVTNSLQYDQSQFLLQLDQDLKNIAINLITPRHELSKWNEKGVVVRLETERISKAIIDPIMYLKKKQLNKMRLNNLTELNHRIRENRTYDDLLEQEMKIISLLQRINKITNTVVQK